MKLKSIVFLGVVLTALFLGGIFYYASEKLNGEELRKFIEASLERTFPYANVNVGEVRLKFGSSLNLEVQGLSLELPEKKATIRDELFKIKRVGIEIPLWILLGFEQNITVNLDKAIINFIQSKGKSNWIIASQGNSKSRIKPKASTKIAMAPALLTKGKVNLKFTDTLLNYNLDKEQKGEVLIKYFRVNNLGIKSNAAYELKSDISLKFSQQAMDMELSLIGQFSLGEIIQQGVLKTTSILTVNKMYFPAQNISIPNFKTNIKLKLSNTGDVTAKLATAFSEKNYINALVKTRNRELSLEDIDLVFYLDELLDILKVDMPSLRVGDGRIELKGDFFWGSQLQPNIVFFIGPQVKYAYNDMLFSSELKGKYQKNSLIMGIASKGLDGSLYGDFSLDVDIGKQPIVLSQLSPFKFSIMANDLVIPAKVLRNALYASSNKKISKEDKKEKNFFLLPRGIIDFNFKNISLGGNPLSLAGAVAIANRKLESEGVKIATSEGGGVASFKSHLYREGIKNQFSAELANVNVKDIGGVLPEWMGALEGIASGSVKGAFENLNEKTSYGANLHFSIQNGHWHGIDLTQRTQSIVTELLKVPSLRNLLKRKKIKISNKFQKASLKGVFAQDKWSFDNYSFINRELMLTKGRGKNYLSPVKKKSVLSMDVDLKLLRSVISKNFARSSLPLRMIGLGFMLKPDISFTSKKLAKSHVKKRSKKLIENLKNKVLEDPNKKIKGLLKGIL